MSTLPSQYPSEDMAPIQFTKNFKYFVSILVMLLASITDYFGLSNSRRHIISKRSANVAAPPASKSMSRKSADLKPTKWYKELFFKLQNLEEHTEILESSRDELLAMLSRSIALTLQKPQGSIFDIEQYDEKKLQGFIEEEQNGVMERWERYLEHRKRGDAPELFATTEAAKAWLVQQAPSKFVDGAWLGHIHKITTPFALRSVTKNAWQVFSEELGDGDLSKHHVYLYRQLLEKFGVHLPEGHSADFIHSPHWDEVEDCGMWEAAVGQLLISLFPNEFLPEILGFNMHFELITLDTLRANHELKALGIDPYYFLLHIVIDNADSGHTAMATHTVTRYLDMVREAEGESAMEQMWKRVQVGYALSQTLGSHRSLQQESLPARNISLDPLSTRVVEMFKSKALVSHQFHSHSRARIGGEPLASWLSPDKWKSSDPESQLQLLTALSQAKPWIHPGASSKSSLMRALAWKGCMFGAFTNDEVIDLGRWIDALGPNGDALIYWNSTGRDPTASKDVVAELQDPTRHHPTVVSSNDQTIDSGFWKPFQATDSEPSMATQPLSSLSNLRMPDMIALWFSHIGLLENTVNTPSRTSDPVYATIIRLLRAQAGFALEAPIVAGMDELRRPSHLSLVDIGCELISRAGWETDTKVESLHDVFALTASQGQGEKSIKLAHDMLCWATRPEENFGFLLGLAWAFVELKQAVARSSGLLTPETQHVLEAIVARERQSLEECARELRVAEKALQSQQMNRGYRLGTRVLQDLCI